MYINLNKFIKHYLTTIIVMENFTGLMEEYIRVCGKMVNNMAEALIKALMELKEKANGRKYYYYF